MKYRRFAQWAVAWVVFALAVWALVHISHSMSWTSLRQAFADTPWSRMLIAAAATVVSFTVLAIYELYATRVVVPGRISWRQALSVGWMAHALSNTLGFHALTGGAVRYRAYQNKGLSAIDIGGIVTLVGLSVGLGSGALLAITLMIEPDASWIRRVVGMALALALAASVRWLPLISGKQPFRGVTIPPIRAHWLLQLIALGLVESMAAAISFYVLLPAGAVNFATLVPVLIVGVFIGILSHSPGGLGVFEATVLSALPSTPGEEVLAALVLYRLIYNVMPCLAAAVIFAVRYLGQRSKTRLVRSRV